MSTTASFAPIGAATGQPIQLAMQRLWVTGQILPVGARLTVRHVFRSDEEKPLEVIYAFPLPRDAAMRRFRISGEGFEAHSELRETGAAVKAFEEGIAQGSLSALARQYGDGVVNLTVGNIRPKETITVDLEILAGVELRDDGFRFRFPFTLAPAYHARAKAIAAHWGEGEMELPADEFGDVILPRFREDGSGLHQIGFEFSVISRLELDEIASPSHALRIKPDHAHSARVALAPEKDVPNRDLVLDASFREIRPQVLAGRTGEGRVHFAAVAPSSSFGTSPESARRVLILLDRSGSMEGEPIDQARRAIEACLSLLSDRDSFGLVAFDDRVETFQPALVPGTRTFRDQAHEFLRRINARGGTELATALTEAAKLFTGGGGDLLILTDGQVSGTEHILAAARAANIRLHCLGIGSASQDRFLTLLARETGGVSRFVTPRERIELPAVDLFASIGRPVASGLKAGANIQPEPPTTVFCRTPVLLFGELEASGAHEIELTWDGGTLKLPVTVEEDGKLADTIRLLQGSRLITDWESRYPSAEALAPLEKRKQSRVSMRLTSLSETYQLASREMSLVAVVKREGDRPGDLPETRVVPVGMPQDTRFASYFARQHAAQPAVHRYFVGLPSPEIHGAYACSMAPVAELPTSRERGPLDVFSNFFGSRFSVDPKAQTPETALLEIASRMEPDGGMPGADPESRAGASLVALLAFLAEGHTPATGAFRSHITRLIAFLETVQGLAAERRKILAAALLFARKGTKPSGDWLALAGDSRSHWKEIETLGV